MLQLLIVEIGRARKGLVELNTPLHSSRTPEITAELLAGGASVQATCLRGRTALHDAPNAAITKLLLAAGADVNAVTDTVPEPAQNAPDKRGRGQSSSDSEEDRVGNFEDESSDDGDTSGGRYGDVELDGGP